LISLQPVTVDQGSPKAVLTIKPHKDAYKKETVTLRCDIQGGGDNEWTYSWYKNNNPFNTDHRIFTDSIMQVVSIRIVLDYDTGKYTCRGQTRDFWRMSEISDPVTLTVSGPPQAVLRVSPQNWLSKGVLVTLSCEVNDSSTYWIFTWYREIPYRNNNGDMRYNVVPLSDSRSRGYRGSYSLGPAAFHHTGVYMCRAERTEQPFKKQYSYLQPLWLTDESPPVSLIINPNRTQHFTKHSLSLSCEDQSKSNRWIVRRYTHSEKVSDCSLWGSVAIGSTCEISSFSTSDTGGYWCESESGETSNPVNITVHGGDVILESPIHHVTEGHPLILRCLDRNTKLSQFIPDFYKDGSVLQTQTTGEMIIHKVSKSDEGFYHCKHPVRGESPKSWVSVRGVEEAPFTVLMLISSVVTATPYLLATIILLVKCYRAG
ncbi:Fc receptor-like protein 5, partial [Clarias magur]